MNLDNRCEIMGLMFNTMPSIFWKNKAGIYLGANLNQAKLFGLSSQSEIIGKTIYEILTDQEAAKQIDQIDNKIMQDGTTVIDEVSLTTPEGKKNFLVQKQPIRDYNGKVIGLLGFAIDSSNAKEEPKHTDLYKENLIKTVGQIAHDIRSPLSSLLMVIKSCNEIPEPQRIILREAATHIGDIASGLLDKFKQRDDFTDSENQEKRPILISSTILQLLADKKLQYHNHPVKFDFIACPVDNFAFIEIEPSLFKRMLSNLINNAVDATENKEGKITIQLETEDDKARIIIQDNGKGMPQEVISKIMNNIPVTNAKPNGNGIGLTQVNETIKNNNGELLIESIVGLGTKVSVTFPKTETPAWIAEKIKFNQNDTVIILDDDNTIHGAWDSRFESVLKADNNLQIKHFQSGDQVIEFVDSLSPENKKKVFFLTDYELIKQKLNGLDIILKTQIERAILVTSHYASPYIHEIAIKNGVKILPKQLAAEIPIQIETNNLPPATKKADVVILDDDEIFATLLNRTISNNQLVDKYSNPEEFLSNFQQYSKATKFCINNDYPNTMITGIDIAKTLHMSGYNNIYMLTNDLFNTSKAPPYLHVILKTDIDDIINSLKHCS